MAVSIVVNVEEGAELSTASGDEANEAGYESAASEVGRPDLCMESHFEYGLRAGWPRIRKLLAAYGAPATLSACGRAIACSPWVAEEGMADGHEVAAHGWRWESHAGMDEERERVVIVRTAEAIARASGHAPVGWHTRSATSVNTRRLLVEHGGFLYDSNAYNDDLPYVVDVNGRQHVVLPYAFDTNDMRFERGVFVHAEDFSRYCIAAFDRLLLESTSSPRMMSIGLHPRTIGRPGRVSGLEQFLQHAAARSEVWVARRDEIAHAFRAAIGLSPWVARDGTAAIAAAAPPRS
jgi:peptidoglycan/xylan/chitin deacetylase (PgdA/CDA1 family)